MTITISGKTFATRKPADLDAALVVTTGCNARENLNIVSGHPLPSKIAAALRPFLPDDGPSVPELAIMVEKELALPSNTLIADARKLLASGDAPAAIEKKAD